MCSSSSSSSNMMMVRRMSGNLFRPAVTVMPGPKLGEFPMSERQAQIEKQYHVNDTGKSIITFF